MSQRYGCLICPSGRILFYSCSFLVLCFFTDFLHMLDAWSVPDVALPVSFSSFHFFPRVFALSAPEVSLAAFCSFVFLFLLFVLFLSFHRVLHVLDAGSGCILVFCCSCFQSFH